MLPISRLIAVVLILVIIVGIALVAMLNDSAGHVKSFSDAIGFCSSLGRSSCRSLKSLPASWRNSGIAMEGGSQTCQELMECDSCESCGFND